MLSVLRQCLNFTRISFGVDDEVPQLWEMEVREDVRPHIDALDLNDMSDVMTKLERCEMVKASGVADSGMRGDELRTE